MNGQMACCPRCFLRGETVPLICTFAWRAYEFYCLACGGHFDWLQPHGVEATPEIDARYAALDAEWEQLGGNNLIAGGAYHKGCAQCFKDGDESGTLEPHNRHATADEWAAHEAAAAALKERAAA